MSFWKQLTTSTRTSVQRWMFALLTLVLGANAAQAAGGENVVLRFSGSDMNYLYISLGLGVLAIAVGLYFAKQVKSMSPGNEKMQEVGRAIREGALAYLRRQVSTMIWFVILLGVVLFFIFRANYGDTMKGIWTSVAFLAGVAASYIAGYIGMLLAVEGNMRTAHAALTSYSKALTVAFRSGAVAGLITVGMGLLGATVIIIAGGAEAMKYLVGFGFGGSLAALFMRVGGGIFTKAADVGADLVGKVEAGIPEDDPRNPAVIADNVGDNVGDCAGMAADVFESYEVTLVAAIVLGAATSAIFDQSTWMKLIIFALMARGVGIIASILGIFMVKGSDDINSDPLKSIRRGFYVSAAIAAVFTFALAWFLMGGQGNKIVTTQFVSTEASLRKEMDVIRGIQQRIATDKKLEGWRVSVDDIRNDAAFKKLAIDDEATANQKIQQAMQPVPSNQPKPTEYSGYNLVDLNDKESKFLGYTVMSQPATPTEQSKPVELRTELSKDGKAKEYHVFKLKITPKQNTQDPANKPRDLYYGPAVEADLDKQIESAKTFADIQKSAKFKVNLYSNSAGDAIWGVDSLSIDGATKLPSIHNVTGAAPLFFFKVTPTDYEKIQEDQRKASEEAARTGKPAAMTPAAPSGQVALALAEHKVVHWSLFGLAIFFGIIMAFGIEYLTDYYVSTHKKPVQEVAGVSSAGPAPMIINGFALAQESSVFSVFAIVVALIVPMQLFPPAEFGGYLLSFYGIALVGLGLLTTTGFILAMDTFGPISDNAQGVFEMSGAAEESPEGAKRVQHLDAAGNTTKALTKGFAIATAVVAAVALFHSYIEGAMLTGIGLPLDVPEIFLGLLIGGAAPYLFSASTINAVGRASFDLINEVRTQFRNDPGIMKGTSKPNYASCVAIVTAAAQKELIGPGILAIALPMAVAFGFSIGKEPTMIDGKLYNLTGAQALGGFLAGAILSGQLMAVLLANAGGMWDNAKKLIEDGLYGGKGSEAHKAGVVCDTVGDPFKDTAGPALNPLIKVMNLVALLLVGTIITPYSQTVLIVITSICLALLAFSIWWSKRSSMLTSLQAANAQPGSTALPSDSAPEAPKKRITVEDEETEQN